ncbi:hypothetical protein MCOR02_001014 [Pyricularia oryzae]|nr:hypothetical protein MCOR02_001014 [Pyricularia oryzae]
MQRHNRYEVDPAEREPLDYSGDSHFQSQPPATTHYDDRSQYHHNNNHNNKTTAITTNNRRTITTKNTPATGTTTVGTIASPLHLRVALPAPIDRRRL